VARDIFEITLHGGSAQATLSSGRVVIGCRQSKTAPETLGETVVVRQFAHGNHGILAGADQRLDTTNTINDFAMKNEVVERTFHSIANVPKVLGMWQGSQNLQATPMESRTESKQMTAIEYILGMEEIIKASWALFQLDGAVAFQLSEISPLPPPFCAKDLPGGLTQKLNVCQIRRTNRHSVESDEGCASESNSETGGWLNWDGDLDDLNDSKGNCVPDFESDMEQDYAIEVLECPEQRDVSVSRDDPRVIRPTPISMRQAHQVLGSVNAIEMVRNMGVRNKQHRMRQCLTSIFMYHGREFHLEINHAPMVSSSL